MTTTPNHKDLDKTFEALGNQHRREIIYALSLQPHSISQLAHLRDLSLPAIYKHIKILENASLISDKKIGRTHFLTINRQSLLNLQKWLMQYQAYWGNEKETLANYEQYLKKKSAKGGEKRNEKICTIIYWCRRTYSRSYGRMDQMV